MVAAVFEGPGRLAITERPVPTCNLADDVLLEVEACGVCGSDLLILSNPPGHPATVGVILGHEFVGHVRQIKDGVRGVSVGDRVVVNPDFSCGICPACKSGLPEQCSEFDSIGIFRNGGLARYVVVPAQACFPVSDSISPTRAALAEPLSGVCHALDSLKPSVGESAVVIGAGPIGLCFCAVLHLAGVSPIVAVEPVASRRETATRMGASLSLDPAHPDLERAIRDQLGGDGPDLVVDAVGSQFPLAVSLAGTRARVLLFGINDRSVADVRQVDITRRELVILGAGDGQHAFPESIRLLEGDRLDLSQMISHVVGLEDLPAALEDIATGNAGKVIVDLQT
jgi:threonine dehydrogenase-like Zn-dependent dehydrogenase